MTAVNPGLSVWRSVGIGVGAGITGLELFLALVSWWPHVRLHLIGWAVAPLAVIVPALLAIFAWGMVRGRSEGDNTESPSTLPRLALVVGGTGYLLLIASVGGALLAGRHEPTYCNPVFVSTHYRLDCKGGDIRSTDAAQFYNLRALHLRFVAGMAGAAALTATARFASLTSRLPRG